MCFVRLFVCASPQCVFTPTCETHAAALLNRRLMRTSGIKFGDVNECRRSHTNWDVLNLDMVTLQRLQRPGNSDWSERRANSDDGDGDQQVSDSDPVRCLYLTCSQVGSVSVRQQRLWKKGSNTADTGRGKQPQQGEIWR